MAIHPGAAELTLVLVVAMIAFRPRRISGMVTEALRNFTIRLQSTERPPFDLPHLLRWLKPMLFFVMGLSILENGASAIGAGFLVVGTIAVADALMADLPGTRAQTVRRILPPLACCALAAGYFLQ